MKPKECFCGSSMKKIRKTYRGVSYEAYHCDACGETVLDMNQARSFMAAAEKTREVTVSKWGQSLAIRIPKTIAEAFKLRQDAKARIIQEKDGFKIVPLGS